MSNSKKGKIKQFDCPACVTPLTYCLEGKSLQELAALRIEQLIRKKTNCGTQDPSSSMAEISIDDLFALTKDDLKKGEAISEFVQDLPYATIQDIFHRVMNYQKENNEREVWKQLESPLELNINMEFILGLCFGCICSGPSFQQKIGNLQ